MSVPLTVRCDCGHASEAQLGEQITCVCGRRYDTSQISNDSYVDLRRMANRQRLYIRLGIVLAIGIGLITYLFFGIKGPALSVPLLALVLVAGGAAAVPARAGRAAALGARRPDRAGRALVSHADRRPHPTARRDAGEGTT